MDWLLSGYWEFVSPATALSGVEPEDACRPVPGGPHSIAQIVAHMHWWQQRRIAIARGEEPDDFALQIDDWPQVQPEQWEELVGSFLASINELLGLTEDHAAMQRTVFGDRNVGSMLVSHTTHNAYHIGQIVLIRRILGLWPPQDS